MAEACHHVRELPHRHLAGGHHPSGGGHHCRGWERAASRYGAFLLRHKNSRVLYLELGMGSNTPAIIKYPLWKYTRANPKAVYACVNLGKRWRRRKSPGSPSASMPASAVCLRCWHNTCAA